MLSEQTTNTITKQASRCDERVLTKDYGKSLSPVEKQDRELKTYITDALWKDDVLRALDFHEIDIRVKSGVVILNGHITSSRSQNRVGNALRTIPGIVEIKNNLVSDDKLALDVASALGSLEHTYGCKFFTGASHGVVSINGSVKNKDIRLQAEKCASDTPNTRGVINNIQVDGDRSGLQKLPFMQPVIGENIYFLDWVSGVVKQVIMNPNNRRVIAMIVLGKFTSRKTEKSLIIPMSTVRHLTKVSGFLYITSDQKDQYMDFSPVHFIAPPQSWASPYPYCPDDVLFPVEYKDNNAQIEYKLEQYSFSGLSKHTPLGEQLLANDSLGG
jgi:osmotically-inducible protein OsmY